MANKVAGKQAFHFIAGLNTEASYLTFPENTWKAGDNVVPQINGALHKRTALDFEANYVNLLSSPTSLSQEDEQAYSLHEWSAAGGDGLKNFIVVQIGAVLHFCSSFGASISPTKHTYTLDLTPLKVGGSSGTVDTLEVSCASANGKLIVCHPVCQPILITYDTETDTMTSSSISLKIRDLYGKDDGFAVDYKDPTGDVVHVYNLFNQGWDSAKLSAYYAATGHNPSNAQQWILGKDTNDNFSPATLDKHDFGTTRAPRGRFILDAFTRTRTASHIAYWSETEVEDYRPSTTAFWAGRVWYTGIKSSVMGNWLMFSQSSLDDSRFDACYQEADPTSEAVSDLVASDGGVIPIQGAGSILKLLPLHNSLLVFANNGVWQVGSPDTGFSAFSYSVNKISSVGAISPQSISMVEDTIYYLTDTGVYTIKLSPNGISFDSNAITDLVLKTMFNSIPSVGKLYLQSIFHEEDKRIYWVYNSDELQDGIRDRYTKNKAIVYDTRIKAFYTLSFSTPSGLIPHIISGIMTKGRNSNDNSRSVLTDSGDTVIDASGNTVVSGHNYVSGRNKTIKWLVCNPISTMGAGQFNYTFADFDVAAVYDAPAKFRDWYTKDNVGVPYRAYVMTGYDLLGDSDKKKEALYITVHSVRTETASDVDFQVANESSIFLTTQWDWTDDIAAGKWSAPAQVYRHIRPFVPSAASDLPSKGYPVISTKNKVKGRGRVVVIRFDDEEDKDMKLIGWEAMYVANANV